MGLDDVLPLRGTIFRKPHFGNSLKKMNASSFLCFYTC